MTSIPIWDRFSPRVIEQRTLRVLCNSSKGTAQEQTFLSHQMVFDSFALVTHLPCLWTKSFLISILQPCLSPMKVTLTIYLFKIYITYISIQNIYLYKISIEQPCLSLMKVILTINDEGHSYNKYILHIYFYTKYISLVSMYTYLYTKYTSVHTYLYTKYIYLTALLVPDEGHFPHLPDI